MGLDRRIPPTPALISRNIYTVSTMGVFGADGAAAPNKLTPSPMNNFPNELLQVRRLRKLKAARDHFHCEN